jgi:hypothetical protein
MSHAGFEPNPLFHKVYHWGRYDLAHAASDCGGANQSSHCRQDKAGWPAHSAYLETYKSSRRHIDTRAHEVGLPQRADHPTRARPFGIRSVTASRAERRISLVKRRARKLQRVTRKGQHYPGYTKRARAGRSRVVAIGWAQEFQLVRDARKRDTDPAKPPQFSFAKADRRVTCYYFYIWDEFWGSYADRPVMPRL